MSGSTAIGGATGGYGLLGIILADSEATKRQLDTLTQQAGNGLVSSTYGGLGAAASVSLSLAPGIAHDQTLQNGINAATGQMQVAQTALSSISSIASTFYADTNDLNGLNPSMVDSIAAQAQEALAEVAGLLDTTDGPSFVFAGQDSGNPPVPDPDAIWSSGFATQIQSLVAGLATSGPAAVTAGTLAVAASNAAGTSPFSPALSQPAANVNALRGTVQTGPGQSVPSGIMASANADIASTGSSTTGSYMRDILRALATLGSLSSSQLDTAGFSTVVADVHTSLGNAITALNQDAGVMGNRQTQLTATATQLQDTQDALSSQLSNVQDVDMAKTLTSLSAAQTQLQASYQLISRVQSLSLVNYLTSGG